MSSNKSLNKLTVDIVDNNNEQSPPINEIRIILPILLKISDYLNNTLGKLCDFSIRYSGRITENTFEVSDSSQFNLKNFKNTPRIKPIIKPKVFSWRNLIFNSRIKFPRINTKRIQITIIPISKFNSIYYCISSLNYIT